MRPRGESPPGGQVITTRVDWAAVERRWHSEATYRRKLEAAYRGDQDLTDALRWATRPQEVGARGGLSPQMQLEELRRSLYRGAGDATAVERFHRLDAIVRWQAQALDQAEITVRRSESAGRRSPSAGTSRARGPRGWLMPLAALSALVIIAVALVEQRPDRVQSSTTSSAVTAVPLGLTGSNPLSPLTSPSSALLENEISAAGSRRVGALRAPGRSAARFDTGTGSQVLTIDGLNNFGDMTSVSILFVCGRRVPIRILAAGSEPVSPTSIRSVPIGRYRGQCVPDGSGITFGLVRNENPTRLTVDVPAGAFHAIVTKAAG